MQREKDDEEEVKEKEQINDKRWFLVEELNVLRGLNYLQNAHELHS